jgi:hypothetical protein
VDHILYHALEWRLCGAIPPFVEAIRERVDQYTARSEARLYYEFSELPEPQPRVAGTGLQGDGSAAPAPAPGTPSVAKKGLVIKLTL